jgi:hypothetical protein
MSFNAVAVAEASARLVVNRAGGASLMACTGTGPALTSAICSLYSAPLCMGICIPRSIFNLNCSLRPTISRVPCLPRLRRVLDLPTRGRAHLVVREHPSSLDPAHESSHSENHGRRSRNGYSSSFAITPLSLCCALLLFTPTKSRLAYARVKAHRFELDRARHSRPLPSTAVLQGLVCL